MKNILFYKYVEIKDTEKLKDKLFELSQRLKLLGTILIAREGINGCLSGEASNIEKYKNSLLTISKFSDIKFKEGNADMHTFNKLHVRVRNEIVSSKLNIDFRQSGNYIEPEDFKKLLDKDVDIILLDARNNYEYDLGRFRNAVHLNLDTFRQFPEKIIELQNNTNNRKYKKISNNEINFIKNLKNNTNDKNINKNKLHNKNFNKNSIINNTINNYKSNKTIKDINDLKYKKIITYCTGGVRCEKASAFLREKGFKNVYQLHGGILNYGKECGNAHWEGKCFVFDNRGAVDIDPNAQSEPITQCALCRLPNSDLHNCSLTSCDKFFTSCENCLEILKGCCSKYCRGKLNNILCCVK
jgi:UPF0176 protein